MKDSSASKIAERENQETVLSKANYFTAVVCKMVHLIALGLPVVIIWIAQPGASKFISEFSSSKITNLFTCKIKIETFRFECSKNHRREKFEILLDVIIHLSLS